ncbi:5-bromo-4-chloroindolyl phosphate hydrolysis family protein [Falsirhodobacter sp. 1013]|uniref:5-bromo-4-chloroindolyl phosphate hydrolysis family protein n=1 Tax=Falsirhodobacter sp. 1013 TaxID=3417566 RepID=UPI003EB98BFF
MIARRHPFDGRRRLRGSSRARMMLLPAALFFLTGFFGDAAHLLTFWAAGLLIIASSWLTREGLRAGLAYDTRTIARRPALPRKLMAAGATGLGLAVGTVQQGPVLALLMGVAGAALHVASFGVDPLRDKGEGLDASRVARAVDEAESYLNEITTRIEALGDPALSGRVAGFVATARGLFRRVEDDPRDLPGARRYLGVYLMGARDATVAFADLSAQRADGDARRDYVALLSDLETDFANRTSVLLQNDRADLDLEISVLRDRLTREERGRA